jgi:hypothetical protein
MRKQQNKRYQKIKRLRCTMLCNAVQSFDIVVYFAALALPAAATARVPLCSVHLTLYYSQ